MSDFHRERKLSVRGWRLKMSLLEGMVFFGCKVLLHAATAQGLRNCQS